MNSIYLAICVWLVFSFSNLKSQQNTVSAGGDATGSGGSVSYSVGQIDYNTQSSSSSGTMTEGVQQPYEIFFVGIEDETLSELDVRIFPNPTTDKVFIQFEGELMNELNYALYHMKGDLIELGRMSENQIQISFNDLPASTYLLMINNQNERIKTVKIIKNH